MVQGILPIISAGLRIKGDFPSSLVALQGVRAQLQSSRASVGDVTDKVLDDPIMALRLTAISNHSYYSRGRTIQTVSGSVNHLGLMNVLEVVSELGPAKGYNAIFLGRAGASAVLQEAMLAAIIAKRAVLAKVPGRRRGIQEVEESAYLLSILLSLPTIALAYYKPNIYSALALDALADSKSTFRKRAQKLFSKPLTDLSIALARELGIPENFASAVAGADIAPWNKRTRATGDGSIVSSVYLGSRLAGELLGYTGANTFYITLRELGEKMNLGERLVTQIVGEAVKEFYDRTKSLGLKPFRLPDFAVEWAEKEVPVGDDGQPQSLAWPTLSERINPFIYELKACLRTVPKEGEFYRLPQAVQCTLRALVQGLEFDRSCFFVVDNAHQVIVPSLLFGQKNEEFAKSNRSINSLDSDNMPDVQAMLQRRAIFQGDPIFEGYWPFVAFPMIWCDEVVGIFYADRREGANPIPLDTADQVAIVALSEAWHDVPVDFF